MSATTIQTPEYRKSSGWFRRHTGDPLARVLLARMRGPGAVLEVDGDLATRRIPIMIWPEMALTMWRASSVLRPGCATSRRAAGATRSRRPPPVHLSELGPKETVEYLRWYVAKHPGQGPRYLGLPEGDTHPRGGAGSGAAPPGLQRGSHLSVGWHAPARRVE